MSDGSKLRQTWYSALNEAESYFRQLLTSPSSEWKRASTSSEHSPGKKGKPRAAAVPELTDVIVHRNSTKPGDDVYRMVLDIPAVEEQVSLEPWKAVLTTPELRKEWDPAVEDAHLLELFDHTARITKTNFTLGWPANPRDAVTISRSFNDTTTVIDISTSLPRSPDEPAYLRPSPPFVRSHVHLFAWCIQHIQAQQLASDEPNKKSTPGKIRVTCFWQHDLKALWGFGSSSSSLTQQLSTMVLSLLKTVLKRGGRVPKLVGYGNGVSIGRVSFQIDREALSIDYSIIPEDEEPSTTGDPPHGMDEIHARREQRRLTRSIECVLPSLEGWEVHISIKASSEEVEQLPWIAHATKTNANPSIVCPPDQILLRLTHAAPLDDHSVLKVKVVLEASGGTRGLRLNGVPKKIYDVEQRDPSSYIIPQKILEDIASAADLSFQTTSSISTTNSSASGTSLSQALHSRPHTERTPAANKSILSRVRRNYIYFSSLLQEPEAKWRRTSDARGVSITQLDSIDPTLVVYRAEATFVGVGLWDLYGAVVSPGARVYWDKQHEDAVLLEDVNELTELWHFKTKPAWPVNGRDSVVLKTVYKSPTTIHIFSFSADDPHLFPHIPTVEPNVIRTQVDLQGWAIEALSPTTTLLTLLEQSDPKGWTNKTSIPTQMINTLAGIGEFVIKCGGPPMVTRLTGAKAYKMRYDHEKGSFKVEYEASPSRRVSSLNPDDQDDSHLPSIECEIRCDIDAWAASLDIVVDPPPQTMSCLRRHRLSGDGGGLWLTLTHDCVFVDDERLLVIVRRAPGKEKGLVMVNGAKVHVDIEEIPDHEIKLLTKMKRVKPPRIPLDQPPVMGVVRRRKAEWNDENAGQNVDNASQPSTVNSWASAPLISSPLSRFLSYYVDQATTTTQQAVAAITPANGGGNNAMPSATKLPMQYALEALAWTQEFHSSNSPTSLFDGWTLVSEKGMTIHRKLIPEVSPIIPVHKGYKVIEGVSGEELASIILEYDCRKVWDDRYDSARLLESYGGSSRTSFLTSKAGFPFRDRGFYLASVMARTHAPASLSRRNTGEVADQSSAARNAIFCVSASFSAESVPLLSAAKYNPYSLPTGRVYLDAWILETLDPYTKENYAIPSTRCTRLVAIDYAGSIPAAMNSLINASLPRAILVLESQFKSISALPMIRLPASGLAIAEKKGHDHLATVSWKLKQRDGNRVVVYESFGSEEKVYKTSLLVTMKQPPSNTVVAGSRSVLPSASPEIPTTPKPSQRLLSPRSQTMSRERHLVSDDIISGSISLPKMPFSSPSTETLRSAAIESGNTNHMPGSMIYTPTFPSSSPQSPPIRQRAVSSGSSSFYSPSYEGNSAGLVRGRTISSAFTVKGEVKPMTDLLVGEVVIDTRLYPEGYYVFVRSRKRSRKEICWEGKGSYLKMSALAAKLNPPDSTSGSSSSSPSSNLVLDSSTASTSSTISSSSPSDSSDDYLPLAYTIHTMPSSPLHSSSLNAEGSTRHLLRITLPTAQYKVSTVKDPLTGEVRSGPKKPEWLLELEGAEEEEVVVVKVPDLNVGVEEEQGSKDGKPMPKQRGAVVDVEVRPLSVPLMSSLTWSEDGEGTEGKAKDKKRKKLKKVSVNGVDVAVVGEKESLTALGREELLDDRAGKMGLLLRVPNEAEPLSEELKIPISIADDLVDSSMLGSTSSLDSVSTRATDTATSTTSSPTADGDLSKHLSRGTIAKEAGSGEDNPRMPKTNAPSAISSSVTLIPRASGVTSFGSGIFGFWPLYKFEFGSNGGDANGSSSERNGGDLGGATSSKLPGGLGDDDGGTKMSLLEGGDVKGGDADGTARAQPQDQREEARRLTLTMATGLYPLSTVVIVALIAFLIGSLLRSLLSPADFIYVVTDMREAEEASKVSVAGGGGWREIRRLLEIKYILGGWDFQVAAVRRHWGG